jgi:hypothetical protein
MSDLGKLSIYAARFGLAVTFVLYLTEQHQPTVDKWAALATNAVFLAGTWVLELYYNEAKHYLSRFFWDFVRLILLISIAYSTAIFIIIVNDKLLPGFAGVVQENELNAAAFLFAVLVASVGPVISKRVQALRLPKAAPPQEAPPPLTPKTKTPDASARGPTVGLQQATATPQLGSEGPFAAIMKAAKQHAATVRTPRGSSQNPEAPAPAPAASSRRSTSQQAPATRSPKSEALDPTIPVWVEGAPAAQSEVQTPEAEPQAPKTGSSAG